MESRLFWSGQWNLGGGGETKWRQTWVVKLQKTLPFHSLGKSSLTRLVKKYVGGFDRYNNSFL